LTIGPAFTLSALFSFVVAPSIPPQLRHNVNPTASILPQREADGWSLKATTNLRWYDGAGKRLPVLRGSVRWQRLSVSFRHGWCGCPYISAHNIFGLPIRR